MLRHRVGNWNEQLGWSFQGAARHHAIQLVRSGVVLHDDTLVGGWWSMTGQQAQVDVLGVAEHRTVAVGEARWQARPLGRQTLDELANKLRHPALPPPVSQPYLLLWGRGGIRPELQVGRVLGFGPTDMVEVG